VVAGLQRSGYEGKLTLVNREGGEVLGLPRVPPEEAAGADIAVLATPAPTVPALLRQCGDLGIPIAAVIAGGFREAGNAELDRHLRTAIDETGIRVLGPNCLGIFVGSKGINTTSFDLPVGGVSVITQSGGFIQHTGIRLGQLGAGFDIGISLGNKVDVDFTDALGLVTQAGTSSALVLYLERLDEGDAFLDAVAVATAELPIIAIVAGRTDAGVRAARSHTDSLIGRWDRVTGLLEDAGVQLAKSMSEAVAAAVGGQRSGRGPVSRVFALCDGGGGAVLMADELADAGYDVAQPSAELAEQLRHLIGLTGPAPNPLDMQGRAEADLNILLKAARAAILSGEYDALVLGGILGSYARLLGGDLAPIEERIASELPHLSAESGCPIVIQSMYATEPSRALEIARAGGIACVEWPDEAVQALRARTVLHPRRPARDDPVQKPTVSSAADPFLIDLSERVVAALDDAGIPHALGTLTAPGKPTPSGDGKWVVRADGFPHKAVAGAIRVGVSGTELEEAVKQLGRIAKAAGLPPRVRVAPFVEHDHELIVTLWRDPLEGDGCMLGQGGTSVETSRDVAIGRMPSTRGEVARILEQTALGRRVLAMNGDTAPAVLDTVLALAVMFKGLPELRELELNPVGIAQGGPVVLDALPSTAGTAP